MEQQTKLHTRRSLLKNEKIRFHESLDNVPYRNRQFHAFLKQKQHSTDRQAILEYNDIILLVVSI